MWLQVRLLFARSPNPKEGSSSARVPQPLPPDCSRSGCPSGGPAPRRPSPRVLSGRCLRWSRVPGLRAAPGEAGPGAPGERESDRSRRRAPCPAGLEAAGRASAESNPAGPGKAGDRGSSGSRGPRTGSPPDLQIDFLVSPQRALGKEESKHFSC